MFLWLKAGHIIAMVAWFAGLFYLPRLFVYHAGHSDDAMHAQFMTMERKLYFYIMWPAMILTLLFGLGLTHLAWGTLGGWFHAKMALVLLLIGFHLHAGRVLKAFAEQRNEHDQRFYRIYNEIPTLILILIVILVVVRPF